MHHLLLFILPTAIVLLALFWAWRRRHRARHTQIRPYSEVRQQIISALADATHEPSIPPHRPAGLDTRVPAAVAAQLRRLYPPTEKTWSPYFQLYCQVIASIHAELRAIDLRAERPELLSPGRRAVLLANHLDMEVGNGGLDQFYLNSSGNAAQLTPASLHALGLETHAALIDRANSQFPAPGPLPARPERLAIMDSLPAAAGNAWRLLDGEFFRIEGPIGGSIVDASVRYILAHEPEFFR
jgi:hypothetical protein